jgi:thioredoxin-related protein
VNIDTGRGRELAREHGFIGQPTFIFFDGSGEEIRRLQGPHTKQTLVQEIDRAIGP